VREEETSSSSTKKKISLNKNREYGMHSQKREGERSVERDLNPIPKKSITSAAVGSKGEKGKGRAEEETIESSETWSPLFWKGPIFS